VQFNEEQLVRVNAPLTGRVLDVLARPGDIVEPGHKLLTIDSQDLGSAKSDYAKAIADEEHSNKTLQMDRGLTQVGGISEREFRDADNDYRKAVSEKERAAARLLALGVAATQLPAIAERRDIGTEIVVRAPRAGVVVERNVTPGQVVAFGQSDTPTNLFVIADLSTMWIIADVYEPDVPKVRLGQTVSASLPCCPDDRVEGKITYISDSVDTQTRTVKVRALVPNRHRILRSEMYVKVAIQTGSATVLSLPRSAIHSEDGHVFALVEKSDGGFERRNVKLGDDLNGTVQVVEGITPHDKVAAAGSILLKANAK
jgi:cobalt-zinc-cadmium efflux system membrane fusion protein